MVDFLGTLVMLTVLVGMGAILYRHREKVKKWLKDPEYGKEWRPSREIVLKREIEDANAELTGLEKKKAEEEAKIEG